VQSCSLESTRCALGKTCGMHALIDCRSPAALELIKLLSRHSATGPMLEQFMLPLGLADVISAALCHVSVFFYVGK